MKTLAVALSACVGLAFASPAMAAAHLKHAEPRPGSIVVTSPSDVALAFTAGVLARQSKIRLIDANDNAIPVTAPSHPKSDPDALTAGVRETLKPGEYEVDWRAVSAGGDETSGSYTFTYEPHPDALKGPDGTAAFSDGR
jgi:methionine-rich copper-binding protein CopC